MVFNPNFFWAGEEGTVVAFLDSLGEEHGPIEQSDSLWPWYLASMAGRHREGPVMPTIPQLVFHDVKVNASNIYSSALELTWENRSPASKDQWNVVYIPSTTSNFSCGTRSTPTPDW